MLFNSYNFVLLFLPVVIISYFILNHMGCMRGAKVFLIVASLYFYSNHNIRNLLLIIFSVLGNYFFYIVLRKNSKKGVLIIGILFNLTLLMYFKYLNFIIENINYILHQEYSIREIILPLGISFFTFQQIGFLIDTYRKEVKEASFIHYCSFVTFFPQLVAGPIVSFDEIISQFLDDGKGKLNWNHFAQGLWAFSIGLGKKVLIADIFGNVVNYGYDNVGSLDTISLLLVMLFYTMQIYFDFSGYCDMASGIALMLNIKLPINFQSPYKSYTITEFWKRWHITLTRFFTKYVYIPLGGNRKGILRTYVNIMIVFLLSGLWHGASWCFILWGGVHGIATILTRHFDQKIQKLHPVFNWIFTFVFLNITWMIFRAESLEQVKQILSKLLHPTFQIADTLPVLATQFHIPLFEFTGLLMGNQIVTQVIVMIIMLIMAFIMVLNFKNVQEKLLDFEVNWKNGIATSFILYFSILSFSSVSTFLYFNF